MGFLIGRRFSGRRLEALADRAHLHTGRLLLRRFVLSTLTATTALLAPALAHAASMRGRFVEPPGGEALAAVEIVVRRTADSTVVAHTHTAADGRFVLDGLPLGAYLFRASLLGHQSLVRGDIVLTEREPDLDLGTQSLAVLPLELPGVVISTERAAAIIASDRNIYLAKDLPGAATGTATEVLRSVPELDVDIEGRISLRGSAGVNMQINGRPSPLRGDALTSYLRQFPANRIERVEVIANPSAKFDPEGSAGIVNLVLKDNVDLGLSGSVSLTAGQRYSGPSARVAWQRGAFTLFSGFSGFLGRNEFSYSLFRQNLLALPINYFGWSSTSESKSGSGNADLSVDYVLNKRVTLYGTINSNLSANEFDGLTYYEVLDSARVATSRYDRLNSNTYDGRSTSLTLGVQQVVEKGRNERSAEYLHNDSPYDNFTRGISRTVLPPQPFDPVSRHDVAWAQYDRSWELADTHPLGAKGKVETGYRGSDRRNAKSARLEYFDGDSLVTLPLSGATEDVHHERFHSGYVTVGSTFGRLSLQLGARTEAARTTFEVRTAGRSYQNDYRSLFPSANVAWDFGKGRTARVTYSKRIERPSAFYLNPIVPTTDSLNRFVGNPFLSPKYTHSYGLDASWSGSRGLLRLAPYYRETIDNWDQVTNVDSSGVATTTWLNAASVSFLGASFTASLRQTGRVGGTASASVYRERHDARNVGAGFRRSATNWSANGNMTFKVTKSLDLQGYLRYSPAQTLAQGRIRAYAFTNLGARFKMGEKLSASLWMSDPFGLYRHITETQDAAHVQRSTSHYASRGVSLSLNWMWGKPPEQKQRRQSSEPAPKDASTPGP